MLSVTLKEQDTHKPVTLHEIMLQRFVDFNRLAKPHCYQPVCLYSAQIHQTQYYCHFYILQFACSIPLVGNFTSHLLTSKSLKFLTSLSRGITIIHSFIQNIILKPTLWVYLRPDTGATAVIETDWPLSLGMFSALCSLCHPWPLPEHWLWRSYHIWPSMTISPVCV